MAKAKVVTVKSYDDVDQALLELAKQEAFIAKKEAEMNGKIQLIKDKFDQDTTEARAMQAAVNKELQDFMLINKGDFLKERSRKFVHGIIGYRTNPPSVTLLNKKYNLKTAIELIKRIFNGKYVRAKEEINKDLILADYAAKGLTDAEAASVGLKVDQGETAFVEIDWASIEN